MLQSYTCSSVLPLRSSLQNLGSVTQLQLPAKQIQNFRHRNSLIKNPFSERKTFIRCKFSESHFSGNHYFSSEPKDEHYVGSSIQSHIWKQLDVFYRFTRPYSIIGTLIGVTSVSLLPLESTADLSLPFLVGLLKALVPTILMMIYTNGINQLFDIDLDKVNKPYLPLASGELSMEFGIAIVSSALLMSFTMGILFQSPPVLFAILVKFLLASAYSVDLPLLRWKKNAVLSATCLMIVRAIDQLVTFVHIQKFVLGRPAMFTRPLVFAIAFKCFFSINIALYKDIHDVDGDREYGIQSFAVILGKKKVFWFCIIMLLVAYGFAIVIGAYSSFLTSKLVTVLGHCALALSLWLRARSVDLDNNASIDSLYMFTRKLDDAECLLVPFVC